MGNTEFTLTLTTDELNTVLEGLGNLPFVRVYTLIGKIQQQASSQTAPDHSEEVTGGRR